MFTHVCLCSLVCHALTNINNFLVCLFFFFLLHSLSTQPATDIYIEYRRCICFCPAYIDRLANCSDFYVLNDANCKYMPNAGPRWKRNSKFHLWKREMRSYTNICHGNGMPRHCTVKAVRNAKSKMYTNSVLIFCAASTSGAFCISFFFGFSILLAITVYQFFATFSHSMDMNIDRCRQQRPLSTHIEGRVWLMQWWAISVCRCYLHFFSRAQKSITSNDEAPLKRSFWNRFEMYSLFFVVVLLKNKYEWHCDMGIY